ncbi:MAG: hypothetical protein JWQ87_1995 [Candidatus Sulfotelmatobacter sp.]|nr:hypothetical protein [Candidatus Sulfotelmatobacter sp.]
MSSEKSRASEVLGGAEHKSKAKKHKVHAIHTRRAKSGGYIAEHHFRPEPPEAGQAAEPAPLPEEHVVPDMAELQAHMAQHLPEQEPEEQEIPKMHTGGTVPKDGIYNLQKGETVVPAPRAEGRITEIEPRAPRAPMSHEQEYENQKRRKFLDSEIKT